MTERIPLDAMTSDQLDALHERLGRYEAAIAAVSVKAHEWAKLAPPDDWGLTPGDTTLADAGRYLIALMAEPGTVVADPAKESA